MSGVMATQRSSFNLLRTHAARRLREEAENGVEPRRVVKERHCSGLSHAGLAQGIGGIEDEGQGPAQQLRQCPHCPRKAKRLASPHAQGMGPGNHLLVVAVGALTGTACGVELLPSLAAALNGSNQARVVVETHTVRVAQNAKAVRAVPPLAGWTGQAADVLPALGLRGRFKIRRGLKSMT